MTQEESKILFLKELLPHTKEIESKYGIPHVAIISQACLESGWGIKKIGNNLFGIKGKGHIRLTKEHSKDENTFKNRKIIKKTKINDYWEFVIEDEFQAFNTIKDCLLHHNKLLLTDRYKHCLKWKHSPKRYLIAIWRSGYATDKLYGYKILGATKDGVKYYSIVDSVVKRLKILK